MLFCRAKIARSIIKIASIAKHATFLFWAAAPPGHRVLSGYASLPPAFDRPAKPFRPLPHPPRFVVLRNCYFRIFAASMMKGGVIR